MIHNSLPGIVWEWCQKENTYSFAITKVKPCRHGLVLQRLFGVWKLFNMVTFNSSVDEIYQFCELNWGLKRRSSQSMRLFCRTKHILEHFVRMIPIKERTSKHLLRKRRWTFLPLTTKLNFLRPQTIIITAVSSWQNLQLALTKVRYFTGLEQRCQRLVKIVQLLIYLHLPSKGDG